MILTESNFKNIIVESSGDDKKLYIRGIFLESEQQNRNGRVYQRSEIQEAVNKINEAATQGRHILGELDHPAGSLEVSLKNVSHKITEMYMEGNNAIGKAEILEKVPSGQIAKGLIEAGINIGVSSRGSGMVNESTGIVEGFDIVTIDLVASPSAINAFPQSLRESIQLYKRTGELDNLANAVVHDKKAQAYFEKEIMTFIKETFNK
jgi:hypothetical protein